MGPISHPFLLSFFPRMEQAEDLGSEHLLGHDISILGVYDLGSCGWSYQKKIQGWLGFHNFIWTFQICITVAWLLDLGFHILCVLQASFIPSHIFQLWFRGNLFVQQSSIYRLWHQKWEFISQLCISSNGMRVQSLLVHSLYYTELSPILEMVVITIIIAIIYWALSI